MNHLKIAETIPFVECSIPKEQNPQPHRWQKLKTSILNSIGEGVSVWFWNVATISIYIEFCHIHIRFDSYLYGVFYTTIQSPQNLSLQGLGGGGRGGGG
jgi:hypothetical protein